MTFHHGDLVQSKSDSSPTLSPFGLVFGSSENQSGEQITHVLWDSGLYFNWEQTDSLKLIKKLPIV